MRTDWATRHPMWCMNLINKPSTIITTAMNNLTTTLNIAIVRNKLTNNMTIEERVLHYTRRNSYGRLIFPHCVRAHIDEIMLYAPWALSATELNNIKRGIMR